jgi:hypothetical protein
MGNQGGIVTLRALLALRASLLGLVSLAFGV